jgi:hypothetical protein
LAGFETLESRLLLASDVFGVDQQAGLSAGLFSSPELGKGTNLAHLSGVADGALPDQVSPDANGPFLTKADATVAASKGTPPHTLVFVDSAVKDYQSLLAGLANSELHANSGSGLRVVLLEAERDGVAQITDVLRGYRGLSDVHVVSHGSTGSLQLGNTRLDGANLDRYVEQLHVWGGSLSAPGDILLYGCDVAAGEQGIRFVDDLSQVTGADIAASDDLTGAAELGGDWNLEVATGAIDAAQVFSIASLRDYSNLLTTIQVQGGQLQSAPTAGNDTYVFPSNLDSITIEDGVVVAGSPPPSWVATGIWKSPPGRSMRLKCSASPPSETIRICWPPSRCKEANCSPHRQPAMILTCSNRIGVASRSRRESPFQIPAMPRRRRRRKAEAPTRLISAGSPMR